MKRRLPKVYAEFEGYARKLEKHYKDVQDLEFTVERGKLYMLQTRSAKRTGEAAVRIAVDMVTEGLITRKERVASVEPRKLEQLLFPRVDPSARVQALTGGVPASPGAATGQAVFDADTAQEWGKQGKAVILVRVETNPNDVHGMVEAKGILTQTGGTASHAALVARGMRRPCIVGASKALVNLSTPPFSVDGTTVTQGDELTIAGVTHARLHELLRKRDVWVSEIATRKATGETPAELKRLEKILARVEELHEANPTLGLRGVRLSVLFPEITRMQVRAIMEAAADLRKKKVDARPEIMIPLVGTLAEMSAVHRELKPAA